MKSMTHTERMEQPLHIEAPGCMVNIYAGLESNGQPVTVIQVHCDAYGIGDTWRLEDGKLFANLRVIKQAIPPTLESIFEECLGPLPQEETQP